MSRLDRIRARVAAAEAPPITRRDAVKEQAERVRLRAKPGATAAWNPYADESIDRLGRTMLAHARRCGSCSGCRRAADVVAAIVASTAPVVPSSSSSPHRACNASKASTRPATSSR